MLSIFNPNHSLFLVFGVMNSYQCKRANVQKKDLNFLQIVLVQYININVIINNVFNRKQNCTKI